MRDCNQCHGTGYQVGHRGEFAHAAVCVCQAECTICGGSRFVRMIEDGYEVAKVCSCAHLVERVQRFNEARIPAGYADKTVGGFIHGKKDPSLAEAKRWFMEFQRRKLDASGASGVLLVGTPGVGKTHLMASVLNYLTLQKGIACRFVDFFELTGRIRETYNQPNQRRGARVTEASLLEPLVQVPVLAIDDLGKGRGSNWELTIIDQLITRRYNANRVVLATTNFFPEHIANTINAPGGPRRETLEERVGDRLYSRLSEMTRMIVMQGSDKRQDARKTRLTSR
ncbi:MAG: DNA replication protein DnaC [Myxococcota bacterium]|jgi:DNA replication protein DnaC